MKLLRTTYSSDHNDMTHENEVIIAATRDELTLLANSLNEALEAVEGWEFDTRLGSSVEEARALRSSLGELLSDYRRSE